MLYLYVSSPLITPPVQGPHTEDRGEPGQRAPHDRLHASLPHHTALHRPGRAHPLRHQRWTHQDLLMNLAGATLLPSATPPNQSTHSTVSKGHDTDLLLHAAQLQEDITFVDKMTSPLHLLGWWSAIGLHSFVLQTSCGILKFEDLWGSVCVPFLSPIVSAN